jgi:thioredoxin 1
MRSQNMTDPKTAATKTVTDKTFADEVLLGENPVLVDFWADRCGSCKAIAPMLETGVLSLPTMMVFQGGQEVRRIVGARGKAALLRDLEGVL